MDAVELDTFRHSERRLSEGRSRSRALPEPSGEPADQWAARLWRRLDRDKNGFVTRKELDCEEFHNVIRAAVAPSTGSTGGASYTRTMVNVDGAIELCLRKADNNKDAKLSWKEFRSLMRCLREPRFARYSANLVFALFDLDNNRCVGREEFRELFRFLLGRSPTFQEFENGNGTAWCRRTGRIPPSTWTSVATSVGCRPARSRPSGNRRRSVKRTALRPRRPRLHRAPAALAHSRWTSPARNFPSGISASTSP
ncbi:unnamed protein product [Effrenium voratum]|uniref:EF-hand domain-containing protein n=1 Tax=Effrenium voratum TaxID=2562239 RepID=A0AA36MLB2_9DINO|nr:unnamed protein product [Effrenium voratum]